MDYNNNKWVRSNVGRRNDNEGITADNLFGMSPDSLAKKHRKIICQSRRVEERCRYDLFYISNTIQKNNNFFLFSFVPVDICLDPICW